MTDIYVSMVDFIFAQIKPDIVSSQVSQIKPNTTLFASTYMTGHSKDASTSYVCRIKGQTGTMFVVATNIVQACFTSQNELPKINFSK
jgi:hypothetical protein